MKTVSKICHDEVRPVHEGYRTREERFLLVGATVLLSVSLRPHEYPDAGRETTHKALKFRDIDGEAECIVPFFNIADKIRGGRAREVDSYCVDLEISDQHILSTNHILELIKDSVPYTPSKIGGIVASK